MEHAATGYIYIYIYIEREREREKVGGKKTGESLEISIQPSAPAPTFTQTSAPASTIAPSFCIRTRAAASAAASRTA